MMIPEKDIKKLRDTLKEASTKPIGKNGKVHCKAGLGYWTISTAFLPEFIGVLNWVLEEQ